MTDTRHPSLRRRTIRMNAKQRAWCKNYQEVTGFEPLMDDFLYGNESFVHAERNSVRWFEDWSNEAHLNVGHNIPGAEDE